MDAGTLKHPDVPQALPPVVRARLQAGQRRVTGAGDERDSCGIRRANAATTTHRPGH